MYEQAIPPSGDQTISSPTSLVHFLVWLSEMATCLPPKRSAPAARYRCRCRWMQFGQHWTCTYTELLPGFSSHPSMSIEQSLFPPPSLQSDLHRTSVVLEQLVVPFSEGKFESNVLNDLKIFFFILNKFFMMIFRDVKTYLNFIFNHFELLMVVLSYSVIRLAVRKLNKHPVSGQRNAKLMIFCD